VVHYAVSMVEDRQLTEMQGGNHPQLTQVLELLSSLPEDELPTMRAAINGSLAADDADIDFGVDLIVDGVKARLAKRKLKVGRPETNRRSRTR
jgi:hypothetical protein